MWTSRRSSKYGAKRTTVDGMRFDSKHEAGVYSELALRLKAGEIVDIQRQKTFTLRGLNGKVVCSHRVDFLIAHKDGSLEVVEAKSSATMTRDWAIKRELFIDNYKDIPYTVVTSRPRWWKRRLGRPKPSVAGRNI